MTDFRDERLGSLVSVKHGFAFSGENFSDDLTYPTLLTPGNFAVGGGFKTSKPKTFSGDFPLEYVLSPGDLVVTMTDLSRDGATLGAPAVVPSVGTYLHNQRIGLVQIVKPDTIDRGFLHYFLRTRQYRSHILGTATGSTVRHTSPGRIHAYVARIPCLASQRGIAEVMRALDDKIAANTTLATAADALSTLHVARMLDGADETPLSQTADFVNGKAFTKGASGTGRVVIRIAELNSGLGGSTVFSDIEVANQYLARPGDVLFAWSGSLTLSRWFRDEGIINQHIFKVIPKAGIPRWLVHGLIARKLAHFKSIAADKATTMGHIQRHHLDLSVPIPNPDVIKANDELMTCLWDRALAAERESLQLAELRDVLLPQLMSGKLRVRDAKDIVGDVV